MSCGGELGVLGGICCAAFRVWGSGSGELMLLAQPCEPVPDSHFRGLTRAEEEHHGKYNEGFRLLSKLEPNLKMAPSKTPLRLRSPHGGKNNLA